MPYTVDQLIDDFRSDVADRPDVDGNGVGRDTLWSDSDIIRYANHAVTQFAVDTLSYKKNFTLTLEAGKANYRPPYEVKEIVRARLTYPTVSTTGRLLDIFDLNDGCLTDDYGIVYFSTIDLETKTGQPRGITRDFDPEFLRVFPIPDAAGSININASVVPQELYAGMPLPFDSFEDRYIIQLWMKNLAYRKQDADVLDLNRADSYRNEYFAEVKVRAADFDRDHRNGGVIRSNW